MLAFLGPDLTHCNNEHLFGLADYAVLVAIECDQLRLRVTLYDVRLTIERYSVRIATGLVTVETLNEIL